LQEINKFKIFTMMKKSAYSIFLCCFLISLLSSCSVEETRNETENQLHKPVDQLEAKLKVRKDTKKLSNLFQKLGVVELKMVKENGTIAYLPQTKKSFGFNGEQIDFSRYTLIFNGNKLSLKRFPEYSVTIIKDKLIFSTPENNYMTIEEVNFQDDNIFALTAFIQELTLEEGKKSEVDLSRNQAKCSFWDTYYVVSGGATRSASENNLTQSIATEDTSGCTAIGGTDTSCVTDNHGCMSTQTYCC
jgi:hypothetical protein